MGVLKTPSKQATPMKGKTPLKNPSPKTATPNNKSAKKKASLAVKLTTPGGKEHVLSTPKSAKQEKSKLNGSAQKPTNGSASNQNNSPKSNKKKQRKSTVAGAPEVAGDTLKIGQTPGKTPKKNVPSPGKSPESGKKRKASVSTSENVSPKVKQFAGTKSLDGASADSSKISKKQKLSKEEKGKTPNKVASGSSPVNRRMKNRMRQRQRKLKKNLNTEIKKSENKEIDSKVQQKIQKQLDVLLKTKAGGPKVKKEVEVGTETKSPRQKKRSRKAKKLVENVSSALDASPKSGDLKVKKQTAVKKDAKVAAKAKKVDIPTAEEDSGEEEENETEVAAIFKGFGNINSEDDSSDDDEESDENSDYEVEKTVQASKVTKSLKYDPEEADALIANKEDKKDGKKTAKKDKKKQNQEETVDESPSKTDGFNDKNKSRYVVFVGNIPFTANEQDLRKHFASAGNVESVRIPKDKETNKPRGIAFVEFKNKESYEKSLSLHQSSFEGRRINVSYTMAGKKNTENKQNIIKSKNFKLHAMKDSGMLAGSKSDNKKRSTRRKKARNSSGTEGNTD